MAIVGDERAWVAAVVWIAATLGVVALCGCICCLIAAWRVVQLYLSKKATLDAVKNETEITRLDEPLLGVVFQAHESSQFAFPAFISRSAPAIKAGRSGVSPAEGTMWLRLSLDACETCLASGLCRARFNAHSDPARHFVFAAEPRSADFEPLADELAAVLAAMPPSAWSASDELSVMHVPSALRPRIWRALLTNGATAGRARVGGEGRSDAASLQAEAAAVINADVPRSRFLADFGVAREEGEARLRQLLLLWSAQNPTLEYAQGIDSVGATLLLGCGGDVDVGLASMQAMMTTPLMVSFAGRREGDGGGGSDAFMSQRIAILAALVRFWDPPLSNHLTKIGLEYEFFAVPWLLTLFADTLPTRAVLEVSFPLCYILRESCSQFDSLPQTSLTISPRVLEAMGHAARPDRGPQRSAVPLARDAPAAPHEHPGARLQRRHGVHVRHKRRGV
jgi:hypothetical protein